MSRVSLLILFFLIWALVFTALAGIHLLANDPMATVLPGDGCGQITNHVLHRALVCVLSIAYLLAALLAFACARALVYQRGKGLFYASAGASLIVFAAFSYVHVVNQGHLRACDVFFMGSRALSLNCAAAMMILALGAVIAWTARVSSPPDVR